MPAMTNLLLKGDASATDIALVPVSDVPFPKWRTDVDGESELQATKLDVQWERLKNGKTRVNVKLVKPIMEVIPSGTVTAAGVAAAPKVADEEFISVTMMCSPRGTQSTRAELLRLVSHLLSGATSVTATGMNPSLTTVGAFKGSTAPVVYGLVHLLFPGA